MSQTSPILSLPYLQPSQAQKHVTHNDALQMLDLAVQLRVESFETSTPPVNPAEGQVFVPAAGATDAWAGHSGEIAVWRDGSWQFTVPLTGWRAWDVTSQRLWVWTGSVWTPPVAATDNLSGLGVGTAADSTNVLSTSGAATLLSHAGAGHQVKVNKASATDSASLLFQSNWSGRAEMGLAGSDDFSIKVSPDGTTWTEALRFAAGNGRVCVGSTAPAARLHAESNTPEPVIRARMSDTTFADTILEVIADGTGSAGFDFARFTSSGQSDAEFIFGGDGNALCDGSWTGGGADYAEFFEWVDDNSDREDRRGLSVVLEGTRIRPAEPGEDPIGVISSTPSVVGDGDVGRWKGKYLRDAFGAVLTESCEVLIWEDATGRHTCAVNKLPDGFDVPKDAVRANRPQRILNPDYVESSQYVPRAERPEWDMVGLIGKLRMRVGQPVSSRWIRLRRITDEVEEWLIR